MPTGVAKAAAVSFDAKAGARPAGAGGAKLAGTSSGASGRDDADGGGGEGASAAAAAASAAASAARPGYEGKSACSLHADTVHWLARALSDAQGVSALHVWVAGESERTHRLPEAFREVWELYERSGAQMRRLDAHGPQAGGQTPGLDAPPEAEGGVPGGVADGGGGEGGVGPEEALDVETLHARLRRRMRHSMHVLMQERNPDSYYREVTHLEPT